MEESAIDAMISDLPVGPSGEGEPAPEESASTDVSVPEEGEAVENPVEEPPKVELSPEEVKHKRFTKRVQQMAQAMKSKDSEIETLKSQLSQLVTALQARPDVVNGLLKAPEAATEGPQVNEDDDDDTDEYTRSLIDRRVARVLEARERAAEEARKAEEEARKAESQKTFAEKQQAMQAAIMSTAEALDLNGNDILDAILAKHPVWVETKSIAKLGKALAAPKASARSVPPPPVRGSGSAGPRSTSKTSLSDAEIEASIRSLPK